MKYFSLFIIILFFILVACSSGNEPEASMPTATASLVVETEATLPPPNVDIDTLATTTSPINMPPTTIPSINDNSNVTFPVFPWPKDRFGYGVQSHATIGDPKVTMDVVANQLGMDWIKVQFVWPLVQPNTDTFDWYHYDGVVNDAHEQGLNLMFSVVGSPAWSRSSGNLHGPPDDFNLYANFLSQLVARYKGKVHAIEVWNEQNLDREWQMLDGIVPATYVDLLARSHNAIKSIDPDIIVVSGALSPTGPGDWVRWADDFEYMEQALAAGMLDYTDCVGAHHNGYNIPPDLAYDQTGTFPEAETAKFEGPYKNPYHLWSFKTTLEGYVERIRAYDPNMKLCVTEFGWASSEGYDEYPAGFEFAQDVTLQEQADYIVQAFNQMHDSGDVWLAFLFNFDFGNKSNGPTDDPVPYSIVDTQGAPRPAFGAVAAMEKRP